MKTVIFGKILWKKGKLSDYYLNNIIDAILLYEHSFEWTEYELSDFNLEQSSLQSSLEVQFKFQKLTENHVFLPFLVQIGEIYSKIRVFGYLLV